MEVFRVLDGEDEGFEELDGGFDVVEVGGFHDGVHAAEGEGDKGGGDTFAVVENLVGICAGETAGGFVLEIDFVFLRKLDEALDDERVVAGSVGDGWAFSEFHETELCGVDARGVGGVGYIEAKADFRIEAVGGHFRAVAADFLLDGVEANQGDGGLFAGGGDAFHHLGDDVGADAVVQGAGNDAFVGEFGGAVLVDHGVADAESHGGDFFGV